MAFNCCYRLESQKKSCLAAFLAGFLEKNLLYLLIHARLYVNAHLTASGRKQTARSSDEKVFTAPPRRLSLSDATFIPDFDHAV